MHTADAVKSCPSGEGCDAAAGEDYSNFEWWSACQDGCEKGEAWLEITVPVSAVESFGCQISGYEQTFFEGTNIFLVIPSKHFFEGANIFLYYKIQCESESR